MPKPAIETQNSKQLTVITFWFAAALGSLKDKKKNKNPTINKVAPKTTNTIALSTSSRDLFKRLCKALFRVLVSSWFNSCLTTFALQKGHFFKKLSIIISPHLSYLKNIQCSVPTINGLIKINIQNKKGKLITKIEKPEGIKIDE